MKEQEECTDQKNTDTKNTTTLQPKCMSGFFSFCYLYKIFNANDLTLQWQNNINKKNMCPIFFWHIHSPCTLPFISCQQNNLYSTLCNMRFINILMKKN